MYKQFRAPCAWRGYVSSNSVGRQMNTFPCSSLSSCLAATGDVYSSVAPSNRCPCVRPRTGSLGKATVSPKTNLEDLRRGNENGWRRAISLLIVETKIEESPLNSGAIDQSCGLTSSSSSLPGLKTRQPVSGPTRILSPPGVSMRNLGRAPFLARGNERLPETIFKYIVPYRHASRRPNESALCGVTRSGEKVQATTCARRAAHVKVATPDSPRGRLTTNPQALSRPPTQILFSRCFQVAGPVTCVDPSCTRLAMSA